MRGSQDFSIRLLQVHSSTLPHLEDLVSTGRSLTPVDVGVTVHTRGKEPTHTNETLLSCFWSSSRSKVENVCLCVCVREKNRNYVSRSVRCICAMSVRCVCVRKCGEGNGGGVFFTAATSSDSDVTVRLGLCRQCG